MHQHTTHTIHCESQKGDATGQHDIPFSVALIKVFLPRPSGNREVVHVGLCLSDNLSLRFHVYRWGTRRWGTWGTRRWRWLALRRWGTRRWGTLRASCMLKKCRRQCFCKKQNMKTVNSSAPVLFLHQTINKKKCRQK